MLMFVLPCRRKPASADAAARLRWLPVFFFVFFIGVTSVTHQKSSRDRKFNIYVYIRLFKIYIYINCFKEINLQRKDGCKVLLHYRKHF